MELAGEIEVQGELAVGGRGQGAEGGRGQGAGETS